MADQRLEQLRDELFRTGERAIQRRLTSTERDQLIDAYNSSSQHEPYDKCVEALRRVLGVDISREPRLLEKSASVDLVMQAIRNLQQAAQTSAQGRR